MSKVAGVKRKLEGVSLSNDEKVMPTGDASADSSKVRTATEKSIAHYFSPKPKQTVAKPLNATQTLSNAKVQREPSPSRRTSSSVPRSTHASVSKPASSTSASTTHSTVQRSSLASTSSAASSSQVRVGVGVGVASRVAASTKPKAGAGVGSASGTTAGGSASSDKSGGFWKQKLLAAMNDDTLKVFEDDRVVVIRDAYPKARFHFLCLPKRSINTLTDLNSDDVELLRWMRRCAEQVCVQHAGLPPSSNEQRESSLRSKFKFGYHAIPSMNRLHLHAISTDFNSPCLKTRKHWNSFTTPYFLDAQAVESELERTGTVQVDRAKCAKWMDEALRCHVCKREFATLPALKLHIASHL